MSMLAKDCSGDHLFVDIIINLNLATCIKSLNILWYVQQVISSVLSTNLVYIKVCLVNA